MITFNPITYNPIFKIEIKNKIVPDEYKNYNNLQNGQNILAIYNTPIFKGLKKPAIDSTRIFSFNIPNLHQISTTGLRGESLSSKKNRKFLYPISSSGITTIIDLRDKYTSEKYPELCQKHGLKYINVPIDSASIDDKVIIQNLPKLFEIINNENYYIACALGLHRTDIALALNYIFNPTEHDIPEMYGHQIDGIFKSEDILRRINSIKRNLTTEDLQNFGWDNSFDETFQTRKANFINKNNLLASI